MQETLYHQRLDTIIQPYNIVNIFYIYGPEAST